MNIAHFGILYFCRTDRMPHRDSPAFTYTNVHPSCSHFTLLVAERNTPCTSVCLAVERGTHCTERLYCWWWKEMYTPCTAAVKRNTLWFCTVHTPCERLWWWKWYTLHIHRLPSYGIEEYMNILTVYVFSRIVLNRLAYKITAKQLLDV